MTISVCLKGIVNEMVFIASDSENVQERSFLLLPYNWSHLLKAVD
jgi:hypothetical protein